MLRQIKTFSSLTWHLVFEKRKQHTIYKTMQTMRKKKKRSYPLHFSENSEKIESGQFLQVLYRPHPACQKTGEELRVLRYVFEAGGNAEIMNSNLVRSLGLNSQNFLRYIIKKILELLVAFTK